MDESSTASPENRPRYSMLSRLLLLATLGLFTQLTRFQNQVRVNYTAPLLSVTVHGTPYVFEFPNLAVQEISLRTQKSAAGEMVLQSLELQEPSAVIGSSHWRGVYFAGFDVFGTFKRGEYPAFKRTLGDWWYDRQLSVPQVLYKGLLENGFGLSLVCVGRGGLELTLRGEKSAIIKLTDGLMGNDLTVRIPDRPREFYLPPEPPTANLFRMLNLFAEAGFLALLISILFRAVVAVAERFGCGGSSRNSAVRIPDAALLALISLIHFAVSLWFGYSILAGIPHIPDSDNYYRLATMFGRGMFAAPLPAEPGEAFRGMGGLILGDALTYFYTFFWPAVLGLFIRLDIPSVANPLISALTIVLVFLLGRRLFDLGTARIAALIYACVPYTIVMSGDYMLHPLTQLCLMASMYCCLRAEQSRWKWVVAAGTLAAYAFALRQLTSAAILAPFALYLCPRLGFKNVLRYAAWGFLGGLPVLCLYLINNHFLTGAWFTSPYVRWHGLEWGVAHLSFGLNWADSTLALLPGTLFAMPAAMLSLAVPFLVFTLCPRREDVLLAAMFLSLVIAYCFVNSHGLHGYGPRFLFESIFALALLAARGCVQLYRQGSRPLRVAAAALCTLALLYNARVTRDSLPRYRGYNYIDQQLFTRIQALDLKHSVVVVSDTGNWWDLGVTAALFDPAFKNAVFIKTMPDGQHLRVLEHFSGRQAYLVADGAVTKMNPLMDLMIESLPRP